MEEELRKRNTDCVYFLASPLTCKKGLDCEYRHSEIARLNPRDCWYWLAGNCLNPTCGFRHPPLDAHAEASSESAPLPHQSSVLANKTNIPCYFYFNGFCSKGDRCSFLHGSDGGAPFGKALKADAPPLESSKTSTVNDSGSAPAGTHHNLSETVPNPTVDVRIQLKEDVQKLAITSTPKQSVSQHMSGSECEGAALVKSDSFLPAEGIIHASSHVFSEESSEQQMDGHFEPEDRWESSPGFDVLVDDKSENFGYNDGPECLLALNRKRREHFLGYDFEDPDDYDPMDPDAELLYEHSMYNAYDTLDNELIFDDVDHSSERMLGTIMPRKRQKFLPIELEVDDRSCMDLRDHLRKRRLIDDCPTTRLSRRNESSHLIGRSHERAKRHGVGRRLHGRLASEVRRDSIEPFCGNGTLSNNARQRGRVNNSRPDQSRERYKEKRLARRHSHSSEVCRKTDSRERRFSPASTTFTGPKTLAQIKEEKRKAEGQEECLGNVGHSSRTMSVDFQGPKPLSEILKDKGRLGSVMDDDTSGS